jgi:hypothetical protein
MDGYTFKALLMIALFVVLEVALNYPRTRGLRRSVSREVSQLWHSLAIPLHTLQPVKVKARTKQRA